MTTLGTVAVPAAGASAPVVPHRSTNTTLVALTHRAADVLLHLAVCRDALMRDFGDADPREAVAVCEAIRALQDAKRAGP